jgi:hypothetical protein
MTDQEWNQLNEMREHIMSSGAVSAFDSAYMDHYAKLLAKSLQGKGDAISHKRTIAR